MHNRSRWPWMPVLVGAAGMIFFVLLVGCEIDSGEKASRNVSINIEGFYYGQNGEDGYVVANLSGAAITMLNVRQYGDQLEAIDNNGYVWRGTIGEVYDDSPAVCSFTLYGETTSGVQGTMNGSIEISGEDAVMQGTYIETGRYSTIYAKASAPPQPNTPTATTAATATATPTP